MILTLSTFTHVSNAVLILLCGVILLFLLKKVNVRDKLWIASVAGTLLIVFISINQIVTYNNLMEQLRDKEAAVAVLTAEYAKLKSESASARSTVADARKDVSLSRQELDELRKKVNAEFERTIREIRSVYANISDEQLSRRFNNAVRKARQNLNSITVQ
jgi:ABC-type nickel/cobalt efflux system permease component RcnA